MRTPQIAVSPVPILISLALTAGACAEPTITLTVQADRPGPRISPAMWGIFFEDINLGADGGIYAEMVKNRSFEFADPLMGWSEVRRAGGEGSLAVLDQSPASAANPRYLRMKVTTGGQGFGVSNEGFRGMGVREGAAYVLSVAARRVEGASAALRFELVGGGGDGGRPLAVGKVEGLAAEWRELSCTLRPAVTEARARLNIIVEGSGTIDLDGVSLFPEDTWKKRRNGLRPDVVQMLADLRPGFLRFPGGCIVEGRYLTTRYQWKSTIGDPAERRVLINRWNDEFKHRPTPDYFQSFGLGFYEYFLLCEDIGAEPLPILNCGMACQFNSGELVPLDQLEPFIQDALDLIEFANGPATSVWGARRAELGHPEPFGLKMLGVGNEQWGPQYVERYERLAKVLKARHPEIQLISSAGPDPSGERFDFLWQKLRELKADLVDEHYYRPPEWFLENAGRYDGYDRAGPKVFAGEYAAQSVATCSPENRNDWGCALAEAAFLTGLERNADVVRMASYAPLFGHVDGWQWKPNLIWFDNLRVFGTPSYYVQQLFSRNRGDVVLPVEAGGDKPSEVGGEASRKPPRLYATACLEEKPGDLILKVVNATAAPARARVLLRGAGNVAPSGTAIVLAGSSLKDENSLAEPKRVAPVSAPVAGLGPEFDYEFRPHSLTVLRLGVRG